jgi:hypothetical protein
MNGTKSFLAAPERQIYSLITGICFTKWRIFLIPYFLQFTPAWIYLTLSCNPKLKCQYCKLPYLFIQDSASIHILNYTCVHETNLHIFFSSTLLKNSKNIRLWHSLCFNFFLFWSGISKKLTWLITLFTRVSFKAIWSVKMNVKSLKNILIVNHNFVVTIGLPYCYLPFKVIFRTNYFHEILCFVIH